MPDLVVAYALSFAFIALLVYFARRNHASGWRRRRRPTLEELMGGAEVWRLAARREPAPAEPMGAQLQRLGEALEEVDAPRPVLGALKR